VPYSPITFVAGAPRLLQSDFAPHGSLWTADIEAARANLFCKVFAGVLFVESHATASVLGMEEEDGRPRGVDPATAESQQRFIRFLREQTRLDNEFLGPVALAFTGHEYSCEAAATAAYAVQRGQPLNVGVGFISASGTYRGLGIPGSEALLNLALMAAPLGGLTTP
jgi:hypothetical protein